MTNEQLLAFCRSYILDWKRIKVDHTDGLWTYKGSIDAHGRGFSEIPKPFLNLKEVEGSLDFSNCKNLRNLDNLKNLNRVGGYLSFNGTSIENFKGLENLEYVRMRLFIEGCENFKSFDGLNPNANLFNFDGHLISPASRISDFLEWHNQLMKSNQIKDIINFMESV